jgi:hypothetical protein
MKTRSNQGWSRLTGRLHAAFYLALFCLFYDVHFPVVSIPVLLSFIEFISDNHLSPPTIRNYISSIKSKFKLAGVSVIAFDSSQLSLALVSLSKKWVS